MIKFYGKSEDVVKRILDQFEGGTLPAAIKPLFVKRTDHVPSNAWSWNNQFIQAIMGTADSRGINQWNDAGRKVKKGCHAIHILGPLFAKKKEKNETTGQEEERAILYGFNSIPVFRVEDTEITDREKWEKSGTVDIKEENRLSGLPLREVADSWGLNVTSYNGENRGALGYYKHGQTIALGVENLATWVHELVHAADDKNQSLVKSHSQNPGNEIVAELGGAAVLEIMGYHADSDLGGAWDYVKAYAGENTGKAIRKCMELINRICSAIDLIIKTSMNLQEIKIAA